MPAAPRFPLALLASTAHSRASGNPEILLLLGPRLRGDERCLLLLLRAAADDALDLQRRAAGLLRDLAVLLHDEAARGLVLVQPAEQLGRHAPVGTLGAVLIHHVEEHELALGIGAGFLRHAVLLFVFEGKRPATGRFVAAGCRPMRRVLQIGSKPGHAQPWPSAPTSKARCGGSRPTSRRTNFPRWSIMRSTRRACAPHYRRTRPGSRSWLTCATPSPITTSCWRKATTRTARAFSWPRRCRPCWKNGACAASSPRRIDTARPWAQALHQATPGGESYALGRSHRLPGRANHPGHFLYEDDDPAAGRGHRLELRLDRLRRPGRGLSAARAACPVAPAQHPTAAADDHIGQSRAGGDAEGSVDGLAEAVHERAEGAGRGGVVQQG